MRFILRGAKGKETTVATETTMKATLRQRTVRELKEFAILASTSMSPSGR
jgi:hypothetical protein